MKKLTFSLITIFILLIVSCVPEKVDTEADLEALKNFSKEMEKVWNEGDYEGYMALIDDEAIFKGPGAPPIVGIEALRALYNEAFNALTFTLEITSEEIYVFGDYAYSMEIWKGSKNPKDVNKDKAPSYASGRTNRRMSSCTNSTARSSDFARPRASSKYAAVLSTPVT